MLYVVGLGLGDKKDITIKGLEAIKKSQKIYLESYTSILLNSNKQNLEDFYQKKIIVADRELVENNADKILNEAIEENVSFLVIGDPFGATTHCDLIIRARDLGVKVKIIHNASILNAIGECGLQLYHFGQVISLVFFTEKWRPDSFYEKILENRRIGLHTLVLLDIKVKEQSVENMIAGNKIFDPPRFMNISEAAKQLLEVEKKKNQNAYSEITPCIAVSRIGSYNQKFKSASLLELTSYDSGEPLHSLIILGNKIHELELEYILEFAENAENFKNTIKNDSKQFTTF